MPLISWTNLGLLICLPSRVTVEAQKKLRIQDSLLVLLPRHAALTVVIVTVPFKVYC